LAESGTAAFEQSARKSRRRSRNRNDPKRSLTGRITNADAHGFAWAPLSIVADDLERGRLLHAAGAESEIPIEIRLYRPRARQGSAAERFWALMTGQE